MGREKAHKLDLFHDEPVKGNPVPAVEEDEVLHNLLKAPMGTTGREPQKEASLPPNSTPIAPQITPAAEERAQVPPRQEWGGVPKTGANQTAAYQQAPNVPPYTREAGYGNPVMEERQERNERQAPPVSRPPFGEGVGQQTAEAPNTEPRRELFQDTTEDGKRISQLSGRAAGTPSQEGQPVQQTAAPQMPVQPQGMGVPFPQMGYQAPETGYQPNGQGSAAPYQQMPGQQQGYPQAAPVYQGSFGPAGEVEGNPAGTVRTAAPETTQNGYGQAMPVQGNEYAAPNYQGQANGYGTQQSPYSQTPQNGYTPYQQTPQGTYNPQMGQQGTNAYGQQAAPYPQAGTYQPQGGYVPNEQPSYGYRYPGMAQPEAHFQQYRKSVITIYSPKGGIGKSSVAKEIAYCLSMKAKDKEHVKVLLVDADWQYGDVATLFGKPSFPNSGGWVAQMRKDRELKGKIPMYHPQYITQNFVQHINDTLDILCRSDDPLDAQSVDAGIVRAMVLNLKECDYDYILFDASNSIRDTTSAHLVLSDLIFYITTLDATTLNETQSTFKTLRQMQFDMSKLNVILNKMPKDERNLDISPQEIENWFKIKILAEIPDVGDKLRNANNEVRCYTMDNPKTDYAKEMQKIVNLITPTFKEKKSLFGSLFSGKKGR